MTERFFYPPYKFLLDLQVWWRIVLCPFYLAILCQKSQTVVIPNGPFDRYSRLTGNTA